MLNAIRIENFRATPGSRHGLAGPTATCEWILDGESDAQRFTPQLRLAVGDLWPAEPVPGTNSDDWPQAFVAGAATDGIAAWGLALTIAIQRLARDPVSTGRVLHSSAGSFRIAVPYQREAVLKAAMRFALAHLLLWLRPVDAVREQTDQLGEAFSEWLVSVQPGGMAPNTLRFALAAAARGIPFEAAPGIVRLGWGCNAVQMDSSLTSRTSNLAVRLARNKNSTSRALHEVGIPVPPTGLISNWTDALSLAQRLGWPVVVKPSNQDQGRGVVAGIGDAETLRIAFEAAEKFSPGSVIVERHVAGNDYRMLVVGGQFLCATLRVPARVVGDGVHTVAQLVDVSNADPRRSGRKGALLVRIELDDDLKRCLVGQDLTMDSVPEPGRAVTLHSTANISAGGTAVDVTRNVHPDNRALVERAARTIGLDIAGVDFLCPDISRSWRDVGGAICEVNAQPGFRVHWLGDPKRDLNGEVVDWLFRDRPARIPTAAVTGTNGKTTVARMLHHIWMKAGLVVGVCTTPGNWVGHDLTTTENLSGYPGAMRLFRDPAVQAAVIEIPRKGLIAFGQPCDHYDVAALLNIQDDHIGVGGISSLEEMAHLKAQVLQYASKAIVVNAEDPLCLSMRGKSPAPRQILVSRSAGVAAVREHLAQEGEAVLIENHGGEPWIMLCRGSQSTRLMRLNEIPCTMNGLLPFNESNALFAAALAWAQDLRQDVIRSGLASFTNEAWQNPGRYNFIEGFACRILLDFGHNPDGVREICNIASRIKVTGKRRLVTLTVGNRHRGHFEELAPVLGKTFDYLVLSCVAKLVNSAADYAGPDPVGTMLMSSKTALLSQDVAETDLRVERDGELAIREELASAGPGDLLVLLCDPWMALPLLDALRPGQDARQ